MAKTSVLDCRVRGVNAANKYAHELFTLLVPIFTPFVGQKIEKADGGLLAKIAKLLPEFPCGVKLHVYKYQSNYSLVWVVKTCECHDAGNGVGHAYYHETSVYIANVRNGVLESMYPKFEARTDYTVAEVIKNREAYKAAKQLADNAQSALHPFGEYDR